MSARDTALSVLIDCRKNGAWMDAALKQHLSRDRLDRRWAYLEELNHVWKIHLRSKQPLISQQIMQ